MASVDLSSVTDTFLAKFAELGADEFQAIQAPTIYGREKEAALLLQTYERVVRSRQRQTVLNRTRPIAAFSDLCDLVIQSNTFTEERRQQIRRDLESEGGILEKVISNIAPLLLEGGSRHTIDEEIQPEASMTLFNVACKNFLRAMAACKEPVVIFLDDIQWMDKGSRKLIELYLSDSELKNVMFILAYRDEEEDMVKDIFADVNTGAFVDAPIEKLSVKDIADMVARIMRRPQLDSPDVAGEERRAELVDLVYQRTNGNPFHVIQFMDAIQLEGFLTFDSDATSWIFDVPEIHRGVMVATSVADLLLRKIQLLPKGEQETLKVAALLGYDFDENVLFKIIQEEEKHYQSDETVVTSTRSLSLDKAHEMGLVERIGDRACHFPHDKIQSAFQSMVSDEEAWKLQSTIGETYLSLKSNDSIFRAALHLNQTIHLIRSPEERVRLARINLEASKYACDRSAFDAAAECLRQSLVMLDNDEENNKWSQYFDLAFEITEKLARMELIVGSRNRCKELTQEALSRAPSLEMKFNSLLNAVECQLMTADEALVPLGVRLPRKVLKHHVIWKFLGVRKSLRAKNDEDILELPPMEDKAKKTASRILMNLCLHAALIGEELIFVYSALVAFELMLQYGVSPHSPTCIMIYGTAEFHARNYKQADIFARLGKKLLDQMQGERTACSAYVMWTSQLAHWTNPLVDLVEPIAKGVENGFQTGDVIFMPVAMNAMFGIAFQLGQNLQGLKGFMQLHYNRLCDLSQDYTMLFLV